MSSLLDRIDYFWPKVDKTDGCWNWNAALNSDGYGSFWNGEVAIGAHVASWIIAGGEIPAGFELDHTCTVRRCVNPKHLELVTHQENQSRIFKRNPKTHCRYGHSLANARVRKGGSKVCRPCANRRSIESRRRKRESVG